MMRIPFIIAEAGSCHEETLSRATQLIRTAAEAGADACKFQYWSDASRMRTRRRIEPPAYDVGSVREAWLGNLRDVCHTAELLFACSVYLPEDVETVAKYADVFKISSFEARDRELFKTVLAVRGDRPLFISTGMQTADEAARDKFSPAIYLHCVSAYPCPPEQANLGAIEPHEGYSDHTRVIYTGGLAVACGADYLEVHFRLNETSPNCPDYVVALSPDDLAKYIYWARTAHVMRGPGEKCIMDAERENLQYRVVS